MTTNAPREDEREVREDGHEPQPRKRSILETTLRVLPAHGVLRALEPILPLLLARWFGRNDATDVYNFAFAVFSFAGSLVFAAYQDSALVPILAEERLARRKELPRLIGSVLAHTWAIGGGIATLVALVALAWFRLRYADPSFALAAKMVLPFALYLLAMSTRTFFGTVLAAEKRFFVQPVASFFGLAANIGILWALREKVGIAIVPVSMVAGEIVTGVVLAWFTLGPLGMKIQLCFDRPPALVAFGRLIAAEVSGGAVTRVNPVVDQFMAGLAAVLGAGTLLRLSNDVAMLPTSILQAALLPVLLSHLADDFAARDLVTFRRKVVRSLFSVCGILLAAAALLYFVRALLLRFVFLRGQMDAGGVDLMVQLLPFHLVGLAPFGALLILARAHVALKNSTIMLSMGILNAGCNAAFNIVLLKVMGLPGIALSTSLVQLAVAVVFWFRFERRLRALGGEMSPPETSR